MRNYIILMLSLVLIVASCKKKSGTNDSDLPTDFPCKLFEVGFDSDGTWYFEYNDKGLLSKTSYVSDGDFDIEEYTYNSNGELVTIKYYENTVELYAVDSMFYSGGVLTSEKDYYDYGRTGNLMLNTIIEYTYGSYGHPIRGDYIDYNSNGDTDTSRVVLNWSANGNILSLQFYEITSGQALVYQEYFYTYDDKRNPYYNPISDKYSTLYESVNNIVKDSAVEYQIHAPSYPNPDNIRISDFSYQYNSKDYPIRQTKTQYNPIYTSIESYTYACD